jgi:hypothetical protein
MTDHPYMDEGLRRWIAAYASRNLWRVPSWMTLDDLIQEGFICYTNVLRHENYRGLARVREPTKDNRRVFMSLVKKAFTNHIHDLANEKPPEETLSALADKLGLEENDALDRLDVARPSLYDDPPGVIPLKKFSEELSDLKIALMADLGDALAFVKTKCKRTGLVKRETHNQRWCRLAAIIAQRSVPDPGFTARHYDPKSVDMLDLAVQYADLRALG